ncbi:hypothetical protein [Fluviicola sp.]|uniref:hypothetical protein n=1 Tax=Fluviicola sp. TaxID=1917219 RepID=UPI0031CE9021
MTKEIAFGIGCFNFKPAKQIPFEFKTNVYLEKLKACLAQIPNLNNFIYSFDDETLSETLKVNEELPNITLDGDYFPYLSFSEIEFELYIPERVQVDITGYEAKHLRTYSETFKVSVHYNYHFPVSIVQILNPSKEPDPSLAVRIVREFLRNEIAKIKNSEIEFESLGPSPFHVDCYLKPEIDVHEDDWLFDVRELTQKGFDKVTINYNSKEFSDANEALDLLKEDIVDEFGYCYKFISIQNQKRQFWSEIHELVDELIIIQKAKGIKGFFQRLFRRSSKINTLFTEIADFEGLQIATNGLKQYEYNEIYRANDQTFFQKYIDENLEEKYGYPVKEMSELISFFESRRVKSIELIIAIVASIIGGVIGAVATMMLSGKSI